MDDTEKNTQVVKDEDEIEPTYVYPDEVTMPFTPPPLPPANPISPTTSFVPLQGPISHPQQQLIFTTSSYPTSLSHNNSFQQQPTQFVGPYPTPQSQISHPIVQPSVPYVFVSQEKSKARTKVSKYRKAIPVLSKTIAMTVCLFNIFLPGSGTIISAFSILCCDKKSAVEEESSFYINIWVGIAQFLLAPLVIGWIWSIRWGLAFIELADQQKKLRKQVLTATTSDPYYLQPQTIITTK